MTAGRSEEHPAEPTGRFADDLIGLDPHDPQAQEFAAHLDRMEQPNSPATVEGMLKGVEDFAHSVNRSTGHRWLWAVLIVSLMLFGVVYTVVNAMAYVLDTFFG